ncbi:hypothetical protein [Martelella lutilitoris]|nr:hypothetical protein [Martelella lutilitoris]
MKFTNQFDRRDDRAFAAASQQSALRWLAAPLAGLHPVQAMVHNIRAA